MAGFSNITGKVPTLLTAIVDLFHELFGKHRIEKGAGL